jgi:hypothetical protein
MDKETISKTNLTLPYATAFVIYQKENEDMFEPMDALRAGTIYPALYMPYKGRWNKKNG